MKRFLTGLVLMVAMGTFFVGCGNSQNVSPYPPGGYPYGYGVSPYGNTMHFGGTLNIQQTGNAKTISDQVLGCYDIFTFGMGHLSSCSTMGGASPNYGVGYLEVQMVPGLNGQMGAVVTLVIGQPQGGNTYQYGLNPAVLSSPGQIFVVNNSAGSDIRFYYAGSTFDVVADNFRFDQIQPGSVPASIPNVNVRLNSATINFGTAASLQALPY